MTRKGRVRYRIHNNNMKGQCTAEYILKILISLRFVLNIHLFRTEHTAQRIPI